MKKLPKASIMFTQPGCSVWRPDSVLRSDGDIPCAVIPCRTQREARAVVKLYKMSRVQAFNRIKQEVDEHSAGSKTPIINPIVLTLSIMRALNLHQP